MIKTIKISVIFSVLFFLLCVTYGADKLVVDSTGQVNIKGFGNTGGTTVGLTIDAGATDSLALRLRSSGDGFGSGIKFENYDTSGTNGRTFSIYSNDNGQLIFADESASSERIRMNIDNEVVTIYRLVIPVRNGPPSDTKSGEIWIER